MAWTAPATWVAGNVLTAAQLNQQLRDNLLQTGPALVSAAGQILVATAANTLAARTPDTDLVATSESTSSTSYTDLATTGPTATATTGTKALVVTSCQLTNATIGNTANMTFAVSSATTIAAADAYAIVYTPFASNSFDSKSRHTFLETLTGGSNVFTAKYKAGAATAANFRNREVTVVPYS